MSASRKMTGFPQRKTNLLRTLASAGYEAEFHVDDSLEPPIVHYIITPANGVEIVAWGQERSLEDAKRAALDCMQDLYQRRMAHSAGK